MAVFRLVLALIILISGTAATQNATAVSPLRFGDIFPGIPKTISKYDAGGAAEFLITGIAGDEMQVEFTLPTYMNDAGNNMNLIFSETDCAIDTSATPDQTGPDFDNLDPWHPMTYRLGSGGMTIWLGGTVVPKLNQPQGNYSATIVITVTPTGN